MGLLILAELPRCTISFRAAGEELVCSKLKAAGDGPSGRQAVPWAAIPSHRVEWVMSGLMAFRGPEVLLGLPNVPQASSLTRPQAPGP